MEPGALTLLEKEFKKRKAKNPAYSLRAFALHLGIPSGRLSQCFNGKRKITPNAAERIARSLNLSPIDRNSFLKAVVRSQSSIATGHLHFIENPKQLEMDQFEMIAEPLHFEMLSLIDTNDFSSRVQWIAKRLKRNPIEIKSALDRLTRLNLIRTQNAQITPVHGEGLASPTDLASQAIRKAHQQNLEHAIQGLESTSIQERDYSTMTMAIDPNRLPTAKEMIRVFRRTLMSYLENGKKKEVYRLNINLVPVTSESKEK